eukprot:9730480-Alexandrium_andersonii.AAC.1
MRPTAAIDIDGCPGTPAPMRPARPHRPRRGQLSGSHRLFARTTACGEVDRARGRKLSAPAHVHQRVWSWPHGHRHAPYLL